MNWSKFQTYNDAPTKAFETMCNQLFENWCKDEYGSKIISFCVVNGAGGDGGVESYADLSDDSTIGLQAKWFPTCIDESQINQIKKSITAAMQVRPKIVRYIVCVPRDLGSKTARGSNAEDARWNDLISKTKTVYPKLIIELWNETKILEELQKESSAGIWKFWFEKAEISIETFNFAFEKSIKSWLSQKYLPDLNTFGDIDKTFSTCFGEPLENGKIKDALESASTLCTEFKKAADDLESICGDEDPELHEILEQTKSKLNSVRSESIKIINWLNNETILKFSFNDSVFYVDFNSIIEQIKGSKLKCDNYFHFSSVIKILNCLSKLELYETINKVEQKSNRNNLIFLGQPGTGKTQGVAAETQKLLSNNYHVPILIQARDVPTKFTWKDILISALGLSNDWSEDEIWQAFDSLANRQRISILKLCGNVPVLPKIIIIIDGIDESLPYDKWIERIQATNAITQKYPRIRFCFTSRPFVFKPPILYAKIIRIGISGDVPVYKLFDSYIRAYDVCVNNAMWLKYALTTPMALKIFCEINQHKEVDCTERAAVSISSLLKQRLNMLEDEFCRTAPSDTITSKDQYIHKTILCVSKAFMLSSRIEHDSILKYITEDLLTSIKLVEKILIYLENYGIIRSYCEHGPELFSPDVYYYVPGIQGYFDYALSLILIDEYKHPLKIDFSKCRSIPRNALYILSIISIQDFKCLITSNETIDSITDSCFSNELLFLSLRNSDVKCAVCYKKSLLNAMSKDADALAAVTNNLILPLSREINHPLGVPLLNDFLSSFDHPATRDMLWSVLCYLKDSYGKKWYSRTSLNLDNDEYSLSIADTADGCPTIYAWALSTVVNANRKKYRDELMRWALLSPDEFYKLFIKFCAVNDPQIRSDMFAILMCCLLEVGSTTLLNKAANWLIENILSPEKIETNRDISIRYYATSIVRKACSLGIMTEKDVSAYLPPYHSINYYIDLNKNALTGTRMGGYSAIDYDLARYVLIDHITSCYSNNDKCVKGQYDSLLKKVAEIQPSFAGISIDQFILSAAYAYILKKGWNEEEFHHFNSSGDKKDIGLDYAIGQSYMSATHGAQSSVMTICEKYVWFARNEICGFLSDKLLYSDNGTANPIDDFGLLDDFIIPIQELEQIDPDNIPEDKPWHIPEKDIVVLDSPCQTKEEVAHLIADALSPNWEKWIFIDNHEHRYQIDSERPMALYSYSCFDGLSGVETCLFINTLLIRKNQFKDFVAQIGKDEQFLFELANPEDLCGGIISSCYVTPKEVCWFPWKKRYNCNLAEDYPQYQVQSAVDECCYNFSEFGDVNYYLPSAPLRKLLNIINSNGYLFYDDVKHIKAEYAVTGEKWGTYQDILLVDKDELLSKIEEKELSIFWVMREYRREDGKTNEKFGKFYADKDNSYIGYLGRCGKMIVKKIQGCVDSSEGISME